MNRIDSLRRDLVSIRRFARRLKNDDHNDPLPPPLPSARVLAVPGRGEMFVRRIDGPPDLDRYKPWLKAEMRRGDPSDIAAAGRGLSAFDARPFAPDVDVPTTVVVTARDRLIRPVRQRELAEAIPRAEVVEVDGAHNAWLVRPKEFNDAVDEALSQVIRS